MPYLDKDPKGKNKGKEKNKDKKNKSGKYYGTSKHIRRYEGLISKGLIKSNKSSDTQNIDNVNKKNKSK